MRDRGTLISLFVSINMGVTDPTQTSIYSLINPGFSYFQLPSWKICRVNSSIYMSEPSFMNIGGRTVTRLSCLDIDSPFNSLSYQFPISNHMIINIYHPEMINRMIINNYHPIARQRLIDEWVSS